MSSPRILDMSLITAYEQTHYKVNVGGDPFVLKIGELSPELDELLRLYPVKGAAFITAWNPCSEPTSTTANELAHAQLISDLIEAKLDYFVGFGEDPAGKWAGEESVLVLGIEQNLALALGARYRQNAIVYVDSTAIPALLYPQLEVRAGDREDE